MTRSPAAAAVLNRDAVHTGDQITYLAPPHAPGKGELAGEVEYVVSDGVWVIQGGYRYRIDWHRITRHWPRSNPPAAGSCPGSGQSWAGQPPAAACPVCRLGAAELTTATRMPGAARGLSAVPEHPTCPHRRGAIDLDTGAWHCYQCGDRVIEEDPAPLPPADVRALLAGKRHEPSTGPQWAQAEAGAAACDADYPGGNVRYGDALIGADRFWRAAYELRYHELLALRPPGGAP